MRIRSRLVMLVCAVLLPALVAAGLGVVYIYREEQQVTRDNLRDTARALAASLDRELARRESILQTLATATSVANGEYARFHAALSTIAAANKDSAFILSDLEGRQIINTRVPYGKPLPRMLPVERDLRTRAGSDAVVISGLYMPPEGLGPYSFAVQIPVRRHGQVVAFLTLASFASEIQKFLVAQPLPAGWAGSIVDQQGVIIARMNHPERHVGRRLTDRMVRMIQSQPEGFDGGINLEGTRRTAYFSRASRSGWTVIVVVPDLLLYGPASKGTQLMAGVSLLLLAAGLLAAFNLGRRIARPVEALREAALRLGDNQPVETRPSGMVEIDAVGEAMQKASARLRATNAALEQRVDDAVGRFEQTQRELVQMQKLDALGHLTGSIAHDFNNVLQTLNTGLQTLLVHADDTQRAILLRCDRAVQRGTGLSRQLKAFARVKDLRTETVDTARRLEETRPLLASALPANIALEYDLAPGLWPVTVEPTQLELAFLNLVINARDAMPRGGRVTLAGRNETLHGGDGGLDGDYVVLSLTDEGQGMSQEVLARALDPFYTTKEHGKGSGMGLPQAHGVARMHGGLLTLKSRPGDGTTVTMYLPRAADAVAPEPPAPRSFTRPAGGGKILLVDDEDDVRMMVRQALKLSGFEVRAAATADEALDRIERGELFDAVLTDVVMPGKLNGVDLAERLQAAFPRIGVVVGTAHAERVARLHGVRVLAKPFDLREVVEALNEAIGRASAAA